MVKLRTLYVINRLNWREWLKRNFDKKKEVWLLYPRKSSGKPRITYNDAVEEALAFGWIDSTVRNIDEKSSAQRFTPRNPKSKFSQTNKERLRWLLKNNLLHPSVKSVAKEALKEKFVFPKDIMDSIKSNRVAWKNYQKFPPTYKRIRIAYIDDARERPDEFKKRLQNFIKKSEKNKRIGFGGIEKYY